MNNFYKLFEVLPNASTKEIIMAYENKITKYNNTNKLSKQQVVDIKMLKIGLYILINPNLREKYNLMFNKPGDKKKTDLSNKPDVPKKLDNTYNEPIAINSTNEDTLDNLFNVDNSWMKNVNISTDSLQSNKKNNFETNIGDRVFSLCTLNERPGFSSDFESEIRKPLQGREDKSTQMLNKNKM